MRSRHHSLSPRLLFPSLAQPGPVIPSSRTSSDLIASQVPQSHCVTLSVILSLIIIWLPLSFNELCCVFVCFVTAVKESEIHETQLVLSLKLYKICSKANIWVLGPTATFIRPSTGLRYKWCHYYVNQLTTMLIRNTLSMVRVGQSEWDDIKILGHQMGLLISKF